MGEQCAPSGNFLQVQTHSHADRMTHPAERHHVESVAAAIDLVEEVAVGVVGGVVHL